MMIDFLIILIFVLICYFVFANYIWYVEHGRSHVQHTIHKNEGGHDRPFSVEYMDTEETDGDVIDYDVCMDVDEPYMEYKSPDFAQRLFCIGDFTGRVDLCFNNGFTMALQGVVAGICYYKTLDRVVMESAM
uniref:Uncharacterized protein LOC114346748 n=1 Tax=Diabrotica virgifera virgifera TaxID=50390 RepID=A0A6P7GUW2_DIAVI